MCAGGTYVIHETLGQSAIGGPWTGGSYTLQSGYWSLIGTVSTPGAPTLQIIRDSPTTVKLFWVAEGNLSLQQSTSSVIGTVWVPNTLAVTTTHGTNSVVVPVQPGTLFFRLN